MTISTTITANTADVCWQSKLQRDQCWLAFSISHSLLIHTVCIGCLMSSPNIPMPCLVQHL